MILSQRASRPSILSATKRIAQLMIHFQQTVSVPKTCGLCKIEAHAACAYDLRAGRRGPASDDSRISWLGRQRPRPARPRALSRRRPFSRDLLAGAARGSARAARGGLRLVSTHDGKTVGHSGDRFRARQAPRVSRRRARALSDRPQKTRRARLQPGRRDGVRPRTWGARALCGPRGAELVAAEGARERLNARRIEAAAADFRPARLPRRTNRDRTRARLHRDAPRPERTSHLPRIRHGARDQPQEPRRSDGVARRKGSLAADRRAVRSSGMQIGVIFPQTEIGADPASRPGWTPPYTHKDNFHEPFVLFGYLAAATEKIGLASGIVILPQRQTVLVAKQAAAVDVLSRGRLRLGIGIGWNPVEYEALGMNFNDRGKHSEEQIEVLSLLWTKELVTFKGRWHTITDAGINPLPVQRPIPIWFGGNTEPDRDRPASRKSK